jgi:predicted DNA-binding transcriptional regulator AlpA
MKRSSVENRMARPEVSGRKSSAGKELAPKEPTPRLALSIPEFCEAHGISEGMFYKMKKQNRGLTPREMKIGTRTLITFEAAAKWRAGRAKVRRNLRTDQVTAVFCVRKNAQLRF